MKKMLMMAVLLFACVSFASAQDNQAQIKFDKVSHDFGTFSESNPVQECVFTFTNVGQAPLIINQAVASCGCTVPSYTKEPIAQGKTGAIKVTYNGKGKFPGHFKKSITVRTNGKPEMSRLYVEGTMEEAKQ
jgi:opacity protein-like surface antigen